MIDSSNTYLFFIISKKECRVTPKPTVGNHKHYFSLTTSGTVVYTVSVAHPTLPRCEWIGISKSCLYQHTIRQLPYNAPYTGLPLKMI